MNFHDRLRDYYLKVAEVLRGEAQAAAIFPNSSDIGNARELIYAKFLEQHAPSKCNVFLGGFLFHLDGRESKQLDVIITTDTAPRYNFHAQAMGGKSFSPVEGTLGVVSIKSTLDKAQLYDALTGIASIPPNEPLGDRVSNIVNIPQYEDWPFKAIYATNGLLPETILAHLNSYYIEHPEVPFCRRPQLIHVAGSYIISRATPGMMIYDIEKGETKKLEEGAFQIFTAMPDLQGICYILHNLQIRASASTHIIYNYESLMHALNGYPQD